MNPTRFTDPISDRLPAPGSIVSTVTEVTAGLADQLTGHLGEIDVSDTVRQTRRTLAGVIPWISPGSRRGWTAKRWLLVGAAMAVAVAVMVVLRRRSSKTSADQQGRDDWSTPSPNGAAPTTTAPSAEREHVDSVST